MTTKKVPRDHTKALREAGEAINAFYGSTLDAVPNGSPGGVEIHELVACARDHLARAAGIVDEAKKRRS